MRAMANIYAVSRRRNFTSILSSLHFLHSSFPLFWDVLWALGSGRGWHGKRLSCFGMNIQLSFILSLNSYWSLPLPKEASLTEVESSPNCRSKQIFRRQFDIITMYQNNKNQTCDPPAMSSWWWWHHQARILSCGAGPESNQKAVSHPNSGHVTIVPMGMSCQAGQYYSAQCPTLFTIAHYSQMREYYSTSKKKGTLEPTLTWRKLEIVLLSKINQSQGNTIWLRVQELPTAIKSIETEIKYGV